MTVARDHLRFVPAHLIPELPDQPRLDRRIVRTRRAVITAVVDLLSDPEITREEFTVTAVAATAKVSRRSLYLNFGTLDDAVVQAAVALLGSELGESDGSPSADQAVAETIEHFSAHLVKFRTFYLHAFTGPSAYALSDRVRLSFLDHVADSLGLDLDDEHSADIVDAATYGVIGLCVAKLSMADSTEDDVATAIWTALGIHTRRN